MDRKKKLRFIQITLLTLGIFTIFFTYIINEDDRAENLISSETKKKIEKQISNQKANDEDVFYNIEYSGFDLSGNRYILKSKEAISNPANNEIINMSYVNATFYFKDDTILKKPSVKKSIKVAKMLIKNEGRILVRKSGTEPKIRIMAESLDKSLILKCIKIIKRSIKN